MSGLVSGPRINPCISTIRGIAAGPKHGRIARSNAERKADCLRRIQRIFDDPAVIGGAWTCDPAYVRQDSTGQTAAAVGAPMGLVYDQSGRAANGEQATTAKKPTLKRWPGTDIGWCMTETDTTALTVTFPSPLGSSCYRARAGVNGVREYFSQTIGATLNLVDGPLFAEVVLNRAPTPYERNVILAWLRFYSPMAQPSLAAVQAIYAQGAVGGVWLPTEGTLKRYQSLTNASVGQTFAMAMDWSVTPTLTGVERITNGTFLGGSTLPWSAEGVSPAGCVSTTVDNGRLKVEIVSNLSYAYRGQLLTLTKGKTYRVSADIENTCTMVMYVFNANNFSNYRVVADFSAGARSVEYYVTLSDTQYLYILFGFEASRGSNVLGGTMWIDNISVQEYTGTHAVRPVYNVSSTDPTLRQTPESRVLFSDVSPSSPALTAAFASTVGATCTAFRVTPNGVRKAVVSVSTTFNILDGQYVYWGGKVLVNGPTNQEQDAVVLALMDQFVPGLGANQFANGTFDADSSWTKGTGWSIGSGVATKTAGTASNLTQAVATVATVYWAGMDVTRTAGTIGAYPGSGTTQFGSQAATATDVWAVVLASGTGVGFRGDASFAGSIDNARWLPIL